MDELTAGVLLGVAGNAAWAALIWLFLRLETALARRHPAARRLVLSATAVLFVVINIWYRRRYPAYADYFLVASFGVVAVGWWLDLRRYWRLGILGIGAPSGAERYANALRLCTNSLDFLGIGAGKLTDKSAEFEEAMNRCHRLDRPIRFLLCAPDNTELISFAKQAGRPPSEYQERVRASLRTIRQFKVDRARNVEVRFYKQLPVFRLMFINDELCLASHYVFGEGDGSQLPDIFIARRTGKRDVESIYYGFQRYFDQAWKAATRWDFESHLE